MPLNADGTMPQIPALVRAVNALRGLHDGPAGYADYRPDRAEQQIRQHVDEVQRLRRSTFGARGTAMVDAMRNLTPHSGDVVKILLRPLFAKPAGGAA